LNRRDGKRHYFDLPAMPGRNLYSVDLKGQRKDWSTRQVLNCWPGHIATVFDRQLKDILLRKIRAPTPKPKQSAGGGKGISNTLKAHYDAGLQAIDAMKAAPAEMAKIPKTKRTSWQPPNRDSDAGSVAVTELGAAEQLMKPDDPNRCDVLSRKGEAYESMSSGRKRTDTYQQSIAMKPDVAPNYNNSEMTWPSLGKWTRSGGYQK